MSKIISDDNLLYYTNPKSGIYEFFILNDLKNEVKSIEEFENNMPGHKVKQLHKKVIMDASIDVEVTSFIEIYRSREIAMNNEHARTGNMYEMFKIIKKYHCHL